MNNQSSIEQFLGLFNDIDKYFDKLLHTEKFMPYNEKLKELRTSSIHIAKLIDAHYHRLKYFGEIRNEITHGIKTGGKTYLYPSDYACEQLKKLRDSLLTPPSCRDLFAKKVHYCHDTDTIGTILNAITRQHYSHIPIISHQHDHKFLGLMTEETICHRLSHQKPQKIITIGTTTVDELLPFCRHYNYEFIRSDMNIYELDKRATKKIKQHHHMGAFLLTKDGQPGTNFQGIITAPDIALIDEYLIL